MDNKIDWEKVSFEIISESGSAKSEAMEALQLAKENRFEEADKKMQKANQLIGQASHKHFDIIKLEAQGKQLDFKVLFIHAEDQLLTTQTLILLVKELIELHIKINK